MTNVKPVSIVFATLLMLFAAISCSSDHISGKYTAQSASSSNVSVPLDKISFGDPLTIELKKDGTGILSIQGSSQPFSWEAGEDGIVRLTDIGVGGGSLNGRIDDNILTLALGSADVAFIRVK